MRTFPLLAIALLSLSVLAGCSGKSHHDSDDGSTPGTTIDYAPIVAPVVHRSDGRIVAASAYPGELPVFAERYVAQRGGGEPTVGVNAKGDIIFPTIAFDVAMGNLPSTRVMISHDEGMSWTDQTPHVGNVPQAPMAAPASLDPYVYADPVTGRLFNLDLDLATGGFLSWSDDGGNTWMSNPSCCGLPVDDHQTLFAGPAKTLQANPLLYPGRILYYCINQIASSSCTHSIDGGVTWSAPVSVYPGVQPAPDQQVPANLCGGLHGHGHASEATGTVFLPKGQCGIPTLGRSTDNGLTWSLIELDSEFGFDGHDAIVSTDKSGNVYYFFLDANTLPRLAVSKDDGVTWSDPLNVTAPGVTAAKFPTITAGADGHISFMYLGTTSPVGNGMYEKGNESYAENATWDFYIGTSLDALAKDPVFATVNPHDPMDPDNRGDCAGRCFGTVNGGMYDFMDITVKPDTGQVYAAMIDNCNDDRPYNSPACNSPDGTFQSYQRSRAAVAVQVGGTLLGSPLP